ncbi:MAG: hypothetical protein M3R59_01650 [Verrucomicrobiota bacterium]|nr:hypothetical protein [Verrucomicrobiota bacterium]
MNDLTNKPRPFAAIFVAWLVVGILDISSACCIWLTKGIPIAHGLQGLVRPLCGPSVYDGGFGTAALGVAAHFFIALVVVTIFFLASRKIAALTQHAFIFGTLYGIAVYLMMYWLVLPTAFPKFRHSLSNDPLAIAIHIALIGLPTALIIRRFTRQDL